MYQVLQYSLRQHRIGGAILRDQARRNTHDILVRRRLFQFACHASFAVRPRIPATVCARTMRDSSVTACASEPQ